MSNAIQPRQNQTENTGNNNCQNEVETEVRRIFTGQSSSQIVNDRERSLTSSQASTSTGAGSRYRPYYVQQHFPKRRNSPSTAQKCKSNTIENKPFMRDLVLLSGPGDNVVLRQGTRLAVMERTCYFWSSIYQRADINRSRKNDLGVI